MLRRYNNKKAQAIMGEYILTFFLVIAVFTSMTIYLKRGLQAKIRDGKDHMAVILNQMVGNDYVGNYYSQYEPYYVNTASIVNRSIASVEQLLPTPGLSSGLYNKVFQERTEVRTKSNTKPPLQ